MFKELVRRNKQISREECIRILEEETRGVLSVLGDGGYPYGMPMNHYYNAADGCIYFHCGRRGHRLDALGACDKVSFCVCEQGEREGDGWALKVRSVIVFGRMEVIDDEAQVRRIAEPLCRKFTQDNAYIAKEIEQNVKATLLLKLTPEHICGKRVLES